MLWVEVGNGALVAALEVGRTVGAKILYLSHEFFLALAVEGVVCSRVREPALVITYAVAVGGIDLNMHVLSTHIAPFFAAALNAGCLTRQAIASVDVFIVTRAALFA